MAPKLLTPYRMTGKRGKNDAADAAAICEAVQRPDMRSVSVKSEEQQSRLMLLRARQGFVAARTHRLRLGTDEAERGVPATRRHLDPREIVNARTRSAVPPLIAFAACMRDGR